MLACPAGQALGHANYVGPKWETGDRALATRDDRGYQATLLAFLAGPEENQILQGRARDLIAQRGHPYEILAYEGGPSGYPIPSMGRGTQAEADVAEFYGKSKAMAVAAVDAWMRSYRYGWTDQCYLSYATGRMWSSHTPFWMGFRPHASWLALCLRNRWARGDLMEVREPGLPGAAMPQGAGAVASGATTEVAAGAAITWNGRRHPLLGAYAMREGDRWSVFVVSRALDATVPARLRLPFTRARTITCHSLSGGPRDDNIADERVQSASATIDATALRDGILELPAVAPGTLALYVFEGATQ
jgi:hypothetical protein